MVLLLISIASCRVVLLPLELCGGCSIQLHTEPSFCQMMQEAYCWVFRINRFNSLQASAAPIILVHITPVSSDQYFKQAWDISICPLFECRSSRTEHHCSLMNSLGFCQSVNESG